MFPFRKKVTPSAPARADVVQALADRLQNEGRIDDLERELERLDQSKLTAAELETWWHLYGITAFQAGRDQEASSRFEDGHRRFPESARIRFSLGQQLVRAGLPDRGFELFRTCVFPAVPAAYVMAQVRYAYLWNRYDDGRAMLRPILDGYKALKILDDHFLFVRGLPFFGTWWSYLAALSVLQHDFTELEAVGSYVEKECHDYDFDYLRAELTAYRDDRPEILIPFLEDRLRTTPDNFPSGYARVNLAIINGRSATTQAEADGLLDGIALSDRDSPWLADVRILAKAEIAHRFGDLHHEEKHIDSFLKRQAMLFEPDVAITFHLLKYQERLKPRLKGK
jgi:hypothetical protein